MGDAVADGEEQGVVAGHGAGDLGSCAWSIAEATRWAEPGGS